MTVNEGKRRYKVVMFRLSQQELDEAKQRSLDQGARSLSDWVRDKVLSAGGLEERVCRIEKAMRLEGVN